MSLGDRLSLQNPTGYERLLKSGYTFNNPTPGTGIATNAAPIAVVATKSLIIIQNSKLHANTDLPDKWVIPQCIKLTCTAGGTGATKSNIAWKKDKINRYSSGGAKLTGKSTSVSDAPGWATQVNNNPIDNPVAEVYFGDLTAAAESDADSFWNNKITSAIFAIGDVYNFYFGGEPVSSNKDNAEYNFMLPQCTIGPGCSLVGHLFAPNMSVAAAFEVSVSLYEQPSCK